MTSADAVPGEYTVRLETDGGLAYFPGLARPVEVRSRDLDEAGARRVRALAEAVLRRRGELDVAPPAGAADMRTYTLTVTPEGGPSRQVRLTDPVTDEAARELIEELESRRLPGGT